ncbi:hypothetical protein JCM1841_000077 [Sporobolomyces salmonicolor]
MTTPLIPPELILACIELSLPSPSLSPAPSSCPAHIQSRASILLRYSLTSRLFRALAQPLLFQHPYLPSTASAHAFAAVLEKDETQELKKEVRSLSLGTALGKGRAGVEGKGVVVRLARMCGETVEEMRMENVTRLRMDELEGFKRLHTLHLSDCFLAPCTSFTYSPSLPSVRHLILSSTHLTVNSLPPTLFPSLTSLSLTTPRGSIASSPLQLSDFFSAVAPHLVAFSFHDQSSDSAGALPGLPFNPILDHFRLLRHVRHVEWANSVPLLELLPHAGLENLRSVALSLEGHLAPSAPPGGAMDAHSRRREHAADRVLRASVQYLRAILGGGGGEGEEPERMEGVLMPVWMQKLVQGLEEIALPERAWGGRGNESPSLERETKGLERSARASGVRVVVREEGAFLKVVRAIEQEERFRQVMVEEG